MSVIKKFSPSPVSTGKNNSLLDELKISQLTPSSGNLQATDLLEISRSDGMGGYTTYSASGLNISNYIVPNMSLQSAYTNGNGTITVLNNNSKPFAVGNDETNMFGSYGVYVSATRNLQATPTKYWFHFYEAYNSSSAITQYGSVACYAASTAAGAQAGILRFGAAINGLVTPFFSLDGSQKTTTSHYPTVFSSTTTAVDPSSILDVVTTQQGSRPFPLMTSTQFSAISSPAVGLQGYATNTNTINYWDGSQVQQVLTISHLEAGDNITINDNGDGTATISSSGSSFSVGGSANFNIIPGDSTTFSSSAYVPINCTVNSAMETNMTVNPDGSIVCGTGGTYEFEYILTARSSGTQNVYYFAIAKNGTVDTSSLQPIYLPAATSASGTTVVVAYKYLLSPGDSVQLYVSNGQTLSNSLVAQNMVGLCSQDLASSSTLQSAYNNGDTIAVAPTRPFQISNSNSTCRFNNDSVDYFYLVNSTTQMVVPAPAMTTTQLSAISPTQYGEMAFTTNDGRLNIWNGSAIQKTAYLSDLSGFANTNGSNATGTWPISISGNAATVTTNANLTGDVSSVGNATTLATVNASPGTYGDGTHVTQLTVNAKGLVTSASSVSITGAAPTGSASGDLSGSYPGPTVAKINGVTLGTTTATSGNLLIGSGTQWVTNAMSGDATLASSGAITLATVNASPGSYGSASQYLSATVNGKGLITALSASSIQISESQVTNLATDLSARLLLAGGTMTGNLILNADPTMSAQAATKNYVDMTAAGLEIKTAVAAATTANLTGTYVNGTSGVGATFTLTATGVLTLDGQTVTLGNRYLLKNQTSGFQNGVYDCTIAGALGVATVFTRSADYNTAADMDAGSLIPVINGTTWGGTTWLQTATITTVGTDSLVFSEFGSGPTTLTGDVTGSGFSPTSTTVVAINSNPLGSTSPTSGYFLGANGTNWSSTAPAALTSSNDTNVTITLGGTPSTALLKASSITMGWTGTLAAGRLNSNVVQAITNDTNVTGSISAQTLTLGWTGTLSASRINFNSTNLQNSSGALNTIQNIATSSSPTFGGLTLSGTGAIVQTIQSTTTGSANYAQLILNRGDQTNGYAYLEIATAGTGVWNVGCYANSTNYMVFDSTNSVNQLLITQGSGTTGSVSVAGSLSSNAMNVANLTASTLVSTDGSKNLTSSVTGLSPQFSGLTLQSTGQVIPTVKSTTTGSLNEASWQLERGDQANGFARIKYGTGGGFDWSVGTRSGSANYQIYDEFDSVSVVNITQGSGTSSIVAVAGSLTTHALTIGGQNALGILQTNSSGVVSTVSATSSYTPAIGDGTNNFSTSTATGKYEQIGNLYHVWGYIVWTGKGSASAGSPLSISLPAAIGASTPYATINFGYVSGISFTGGTLVASGASAASVFNFYGVGATGTATTVDVSGASTSGQIQFSCIYTSN